MNRYICNEKELSEVCRKDRLTQVLIRYRGKTEGRFTAAAQDIPDLMGMLVATNRYVRDMSY